MRARNTARRVTADLPKALERLVPEAISPFALTVAKEESMPREKERESSRL